MGKMKRQRQKLHTAAAKSKIKNSSKSDENMMDDSQVVVSPTPADPTARGDSLFQNVRISSINLTQQLPDFDAQSTITSKVFKGQNFRKKDKQKIRHEAWIAKIDMIQNAKQKQKERKQKQQTPIVGDLTPMEDALPTLELLLKQSAETSANRHAAEKPRSIPKEKNRRKQMMDDISMFQQVVQHPVFLENASMAIREHLKVKLQTQVGDKK